MGESTVRIGITTQTGQAETGIRSVKGLLQGLGAEAKKSILTGVGISSGLAAFNVLQGAVGKTIGLVGDALDAASALNESQSKAKVVFGESAADIERWASRSAEAFGQSTQQALEAAGTYGNLFQAFGVGREESARMSKSLVELAADLASFNNTPVDDALQALRSGLSGETEPLKRFGIAISDARMRTVLTTMGFKDFGATLTPLQKSTAAYALIMQDSALAQGDFARTADESANAGRTLDAQMANLSAEVGQGLLPIWKELQNIAKEDLLPAILDLTQGIKDAEPVWDALGFVVGRVTDGFKVIAAPVLLAGDVIEQFTRESSMDVAGWSGSVRDSFDKGVAAVATGTDEIVEDIDELPGEMADAMLAGQQKLNDAGTQLVNFMKEALSPAQIIARNQGFLTSKELAAGLASGNPIVRQKAIEMRDAALAEIRAMGGVGAAGYSIGATWTQQIAAGIAANTYKIVYQLNYIRPLMEGFSPPKKGPLKNIGKGAFNIGKAWAENFSAGMGTFQMPGSVAGLGGAGGGGSNLGLATAAAASGAPVVIQLQVDGRTLAEIVDRQLYYQRPTTGPLGKG